MNTSAPLYLAYTFGGTGKRLINEEWYRYPGHLVESLSQKWFEKNLPLRIELIDNKAKVSCVESVKEGHVLQLLLNPELVYLLGFTNEVSEHGQWLRFDENREFIAPHDLKETPFSQHFCTKEMENKIDSVLQQLNTERMNNLFEDALEKIGCDNQNMNLQKSLELSHIREIEKKIDSMLQQLNTEKLRSLLVDTFSNFKDSNENTDSQKSLKPLNVDEIERKIDSVLRQLNTERIKNLFADAFVRYRSDITSMESGKSIELSHIKEIENKIDSLYEQLSAERIKSLFADTFANHTTNDNGRVSEPLHIREIENKIDSVLQRLSTERIKSLVEDAFANRGRNNENKAAETCLDTFNDVVQGDWTLRILIEESEFLVENDRKTMKIKIKDKDTSSIVHIFDEDAQKMKNKLTPGEVFFATNFPARSTSFIASLRNVVVKE